MQITKSARKTYWRVIIGTFLISYVYAILRYNVFGSIPWKDIPFFIFNKAISLTALAVLILGFSLKPLDNIGLKISSTFLKTRGAFGMLGFLLTLIHVLISFMILNSSYFKKFFLEDGTLSLLASLSMIGGVLSFVVLWCYNLSLQDKYKTNKVFIQIFSSQNFVLLTIFFVGIHLFFMGYSGWLTPLKWQGGLPPISLISFVLFVIGFVVNLLGGNRPSKKVE